MNKPTEIVFVLDKSGSMFGLEAETVKGFNSMIQKQKELDAPCQVTTVLFNNQMSLLYDGTDLNEVKPMKVQNFEVGGSTALLDALGLTIKKMKKGSKKKQEVRIQSRSCLSSLPMAKKTPAICSAWIRLKR